MGILAELHGKLDPLSNDPVDRSEDLLTDAVFGAIRHLPRVEVLGPLLAAVGVKASAKDLAKASVRLWPGIPAAHGPESYIEPDVIVVAGKHVVVFEAKLYAQFGKYISAIENAAPLHQLAVQYAAVRSWAAGLRLDAPVVVAVTPGPERPSEDLATAAEDIKRLLPDTAGCEPLRWISWRSVAAVLEQARADGLRHHEAQYIDDVLEYMDKRGVRRVFEGFRPEDYWLISSAQRVAADRVYPQLRAFAEDLGAVLAKDGIGWTQSNAKWVLVSRGTALNKPVDWTRSFVGPMFWPKHWPKRTTLGGWLAIYVIFDFVDPALEVGITVPGPGVAVAQAKWTEHLDHLAAQGQLLAEDYEIAFDSGDMARPSKVVNAKALDADWLGTVTAAAGLTSHLRLRLRTDPLSLTVQTARMMVLSVRDAVELCPALWDMLRASGHLVPASSQPLPVA